MPEGKLRRNLLLHRFRARVLEIIQRQKFIPYHINRLKCGDTKAREDFRFIQKSYRRALELSTQQVRAYMELVDVDELLGFSTDLITKPFDIEDDEESTDDGDAGNNTGSQHPGGAEPSTEEGSLTREEFMDLCQADQDIMQRFGFKSIDELESYLDKNVPTYSPPSVAVPAEAEAKEYDENGFYLGGYKEDEEMTDQGEDEDMEDYDGDTDMGDDEEDDGEDEEKGEEIEEDDEVMEESDESDAAASTRSDSLPVSWAEDVEEATENELISSAGSTSASSTPSSSTSAECSSSEESTTSSNELLNLDPSLRLSRLSSSEDSGLQDRPLSEGLRRLLLDIGGNPNTARSDKVNSLSQDEFDEIRGYWEKMVAECKRREDSRTLRRHVETWDETDLLDGWDEKNCQFYWQTEGLFLCRLTELVYKEIFEHARTIFWASRNAKEVKSVEKREKREKRPASALRNQFSILNDV